MVQPFACGFQSVCSGTWHEEEEKEKVDSGPVSWEARMYALIRVAHDSHFPHYAYRCPPPNLMEQRETAIPPVQTSSVPFER